MSAKFGVCISMVTVPSGWATSTYRPTYPVSRPVPGSVKFRSLPAITVRVCDSIACELAGSRELLGALPAILGAEVRVLHAPCVGRTESRRLQRFANTVHVCVIPHPAAAFIEHGVHGAHFGSSVRNSPADTVFV